MLNGAKHPWVDSLLALGMTLLVLSC